MGVIADYSYDCVHPTYLCSTGSDVIAVTEDGSTIASYNPGDMAWICECRFEDSETPCLICLSWANGCLLILTVTCTALGTLQWRSCLMRLSY